MRIVRAHQRARALLAWGPPLCVYSGTDFYKKTCRLFRGPHLSTVSEPSRYRLQSSSVGRYRLCEVVTDFQ